MDGLDAIQIVNLHIINTHTLFPVALKKMQSLAIAVEVIVFFIIDDDHYGLQVFFYIILYQYQRIHRDQFLCFFKAWENGYTVLHRIFRRIGL